MGVPLCVVAFLLVLFAGIYGQNGGVYNYPAPTRALSSANFTAPVITVAPYYSTNGQKCSRSLYVFTDSTVDSTSCFYRVSLTTQSKENFGCPTAIRGVTQADCYTTGVCVALNPVTRNLVLFNSSGSILAMGGSSDLVAPTKFLLGFSKTIPIQIFVVDDGGFHDMRFIAVANGYNFYYNSLPEFETEDTTDLVAGIGITEDSPYPVFLVAYAGRTNYIRYFEGYFDSEPAPYPLEDREYGDIQLFATHNRKAYIYDATCSCLYIVNADFASEDAFELKPDFSDFGQLKARVNLTNPITSIVNTNDYIYLVDASGVLELYNAPTYSLQVFAPKCKNGGKVNISITNGMYPINYYLIPNPYIKESRRFSQNNATLVSNIDNYRQVSISNILPFPTVLQDFRIIEDSIASNIVVESSTTKAKFDVVNSSVGVVRSGNSSFRAVLNVNDTSANSATYTWSCKVGYCIDPALYYALEFYIYFENASLPMTIKLKNQLTGAYDDEAIQQDFKRNQLASKTWHKISFDLEGIRDSFYVLEMRITDIESAGKNPLNGTFYIDDMTLVAYKNPQYSVLIHDACHEILYLNFTLPDTEFSASIDNAPKVSCNAAGINPSKAQDAFASIALKNGLAPFNYTWNYTGVAQNGLMTNLASSASYITLYSDTLNSTWIDGSNAPSIIHHDSTMAHSGQYSFSFSPVEDLTLFNFISPAVISSTDFPVIEFWVNGGAVGSQTINLVLMRYTTILLTLRLESILNVNFVPPNIWLKARLEVPAGTNYNSLAFQANGNYHQPRIYFDDLVILSRPVAIVMDANGCSAPVDRIVVTTPPVLTTTYQSQNLKCFGQKDGNFTVSVSGGVAPYNYKWALSSGEQVGSSTNQVSDLSETEVVVIVTDLNECEVPIITSAVLQPPELQLITSLEPVKCHGGIAKLEATAVGGVGPYTYTWVSTAENTFETPTSAPLPIFIDSPAAQVNITNAYTKCLGTGLSRNNSGIPSHSGYCSLWPNFTAGAVSIKCSSCFSTISNRGANFWMFIGSRSDVEKLSIVALQQGATQQTLQLTQLNNGTFYEGAWNEVFFNFTALSATIDEIQLAASQSLTGSIILDDIVVFPNENTGVGIQTNAGFRSTIRGNAGRYFVSVVDSNGCPATFAVPVTEPSAIQVNSEISYPSSNTTADGSITIHPAGGSPPYTYLWSGSNLTSETLSNIAPGEYVVKVTDANGCFTESHVYVKAAGEKAMRVRAYNRQLSGGLGALVAIGVVLTVFAAMMLAIYWAHFSLLGSFFCAVLLLGVFLGYIAALVLLPRPTDALCTAFPWLVGIAFILVYGCLFIKTWALYQVWRAAKEYKKTSLTPFRIIRLLGVALVVEIGFLIVWTVIDPPTARLVQVVNNTLELRCECDHNTFWIIFLSVKGGWLLFGAILSVLTRDVVKRYNESTSIQYAIYNIVVLLAIGIPLGTLLKEVPGGRLVIEVVIVVLAFTFTMCIMFFKYWYNALVRSTPNIGGNSTRSTSSPYSSNSKDSKDSKDSKESKDSREISMASKMDKDDTQRVTTI